jgi:hypothetical protein
LNEKRNEASGDWKIKMQFALVRSLLALVLPSRGKWTMTFESKL